MLPLASFMLEMTKKNLLPDIVEQSFTFDTLSDAHIFRLILSRRQYEFKN